MSFVLCGITSNGEVFYLANFIYQFGILHSNMKVVFADSNLEAIGKQAKLATRKLGQLSAKKIQLRMAELFNADHVGELVSGRPHPLQGNRLGDFAVDLHGGDRLVFRASSQPPPYKPDGSIDWNEVAAITIVEIGNYHP